MYKELFINLNTHTYCFKSSNGTKLNFKIDAINIEIFYSKMQYYFTIRQGVFLDVLNINRNSPVMSFLLLKTYCGKCIFQQYLYCTTVYEMFWKNIKEQS